MLAMKRMSLLVSGASTEVSSLERDVARYKEESEKVRPSLDITHFCLIRRCELTGSHGRRPSRHSPPRVGRQAQDTAHRGLLGRYVPRKG